MGYGLEIPITTHAIHGFVKNMFMNDISPSILFETVTPYLNIAKGTTDPRVEFISQVQTQILIKFHLQNLDQASTSKSQPNISLSIELKLQNLYQT